MAVLYVEGLKEDCAEATPNHPYQNLVTDSPSHFKLQEWTLLDHFKFGHQVDLEPQRCGCAYTPKAVHLDLGHKHDFLRNFR